MLEFVLGPLKLIAESGVNTIKVVPQTSLLVRKSHLVQMHYIESM